ncbi:MAG: ATP-dependent helicase [Flavobacteriales bacterium]|nr:ATP-dependent helicase [Flavobacteriales bacterium]
MKQMQSYLNPQQHAAIINPHKRLLVLAGAGAGKTRTLIEKINNLIANEGVNASEILAITFTKNAANEMVDRLILTEDKTGQYQKIIESKMPQKAKEIERQNFIARTPWLQALTISTFHSLCYRILREDGVSEFDNKFKVITDEVKKADDPILPFETNESIQEVIQKLLIELCEDRDYLISLKRHILEHFARKERKIGTKMLSDYEDGKYYTSLNGTQVRSKSEQYIADWLYRHNIAFQYEGILTVDNDFSFRPDFYIPEANLYIEHVSDKSYPMKQKIEQFEKGGKTFVRTLEVMTNDSREFNSALERIIKDRLPAIYHKETALYYNEEFKGYHKDIKEFLKQAMRVNDMIVGDNISFDDVAAKASKDQHERIRDFYQLVIPLLKKYETYCVNKSYLDFNMMVNRAVNLLRNQKDIQSKYQLRFKYILVDEFQDVNHQQVELIKLMLHEQTQLFCVGDDWQSIYGFRGSDVSYIVEFEKHFSPSETIKFNYNYRSTDKIVGASNEVIKNNKYRIDKEISAIKVSPEKIVVFNGSHINENIRLCVEQVKQLVDAGMNQEDILFLYRRTNMYIPYGEALEANHLKVTRRTIHGAKGLEAKAVFLIGMTEGNEGFPDIWLEDRLFQIVKETNHDMLLEEERRLFYVAITRAKEKLFLVTEKGRESSFIKEIPQNYMVRTSVILAQEPEEPLEKLCPQCGSQVERIWKFCARIVIKFYKKIFDV